MNRNLFFLELRKNLTSLIIWTVIITTLISVTMLVYPTFIRNQSKFMGMLSIVPKEALQFKGISNFNDLLSALGFYAVNNVIYMMVLGSIFATVLASNIILKEEYDKTAEYLMTRPLSRSEIFSSKTSVILINVFLLNLVTTLAGFICLELVKKASFSIGSFLILAFYTFLLNILFGSIGLFISTLVKRARPVTTSAIGIVLVFYFIYTISKITTGISGLGYLSPFKYVDMNAASSDYSLNILYLAYFVLLSVLFVFFSYRIYVKKDIYT